MPAADTVYRLRTRGTLMGQNVEFGVHLTRPPGGTSTGTLLAFWVANTMPLVIAASSAAVNWDNLILTDVAVAGRDQVVFALTQPNPGAVTGDCLPGANAMLVSFRTGTKGGRYRGRFYLPGVSETNTANGLLTGSQLTALQALGAGLITQYGPSGTASQWRLCVYSPIDTTPPPPRKWKPKDTELVTPITSGEGIALLKTQVRRKIGRGI